MEENQIKVHPGHNRKLEESALSGKPQNENLFAGFILKVLIFIFQIAAVLTLVFSIKNFSDIIRGIPLLSSLPPLEALGLSYIAVQLFCAYLYIIYLGSFVEYFKELFSTLFHMKGFVLYVIVFPLFFSLCAGGLLWSISRFKIAALLTWPFSFLPEFITQYFEKTLSFPVFITLSALLLLFSFIPVWILKKIYWKLGAVKVQDQAEDQVQSQPQDPPDRAQN